MSMGRKTYRDPQIFADLAGLPKAGEVFGSTHRAWSAFNASLLIETK